MSLIALPLKFFADHQDRDLPTPEVVRSAGNRVYVAADDPALPELLNDAEYYADPHGPDMLPDGLKASAIRTVAAIKKGMVK